REQVCLVQFSTPQTDYLVDPLALPDLSPLAPLFANPGIEKIFHAAEYDVICLNRDFGFSFANIFDTMHAARTLGYKAIGLGSLLKEKFGFEIDKRYQKADWARRPLPPALSDYARLDTHHLFSLRDLLDAELKTRGRDQLASEDFARLCRAYANGNNEKNNRPRWERVAGSQVLSLRELTILNELVLCREKIAEKLARPVFKVMNDQQLVDLARSAPASWDALLAAGLSIRQAQLVGQQVLAAIQRGQDAPLVERQPIERPNDALIQRIDRLKKWRKKTADKLGVESDIVLPRVYLSAIAEAAPQTRAALQDILKDSPWRFATYGSDILKCLGVKEA
ncbi:MAG: HRDC domain-containing protein, partial [Anaerolineales bacterium]